MIEWAALKGIVGIPRDGMSKIWPQPKTIAAIENPLSKEGGNIRQFHFLRSEEPGLWINKTTDVN